MDAAWRTALGAGAVDIWRIPAAAATAALVDRYLDDEERRRAAALVRAPDRLAFTARRGAQRVILAAYLGCAPEEVRLARAAQGKPMLAEDAARLHFNVTRRGDLALLAAASDRAVGIDLEIVRPLPDMDALIRGICTPQEQAALQPLDPAARDVAFYRLWTGKEAYLKLHGWGLAVEPHTIGVDAADVVACSTAWVGGGQATGRARLTWPPVAPGYVAALAVEGAPPRIRLFDFAPPPSRPGVVS